MEPFNEFFQRATGNPPYGYQARIAHDGLPPVVQAPTGTGKTGIILAWLWRRLHGPDRDGTPRRLIYALPQRSLVEQVAAETERWLVRLGLDDRIALHVVMGGTGATQHRWRLNMHLPAILVGTVDSLVSKALNRGYGIGRALYPIDFALVTNGAHWVVDEIQLCPESTTTLRQIAAFARSFGTAEPVRFPLGRYHATPWDRAVNEGIVEWPPSPWRLLRALVATWHTRWPTLPAADFDELLNKLASPRAYWTSATHPGHTRHYMPDLDHKKGEKNRHTDLTFDPFLSLRRNTHLTIRGEADSRGDDGDDDNADRSTPTAHLLIRWDVDLDARQREILEKLVERVPYLGRAESVCQARLLDEDPIPDETWWLPADDGPALVRLLAPAPPLRRETLEITTVRVRRMQRTQPSGTRWVRYKAPRVTATHPDRRPRTGTIEALRFAVTSHAPVRFTHSVLLADAVHAAANSRFPDNVSGHVFGYRGAPTNHRHAHWIPLPGEEPNTKDRVASLLVYAPGGLTPQDVTRLIGVRSVSGRVGEGNGDGYEFRQLPRVTLLFQAAGTIRQVAPELCGPSRRWRSLTPYLPVRHWHHKRETFADYLTADVNTELAYRRKPSAAITPVDPSGRLPDNWARQFRRYRMRERLSKARPGLELVLDFPDELAGPLLLGQLSHFGFGIFVPE